MTSETRHIAWKCFQLLDPESNQREDPGVTLENTTEIYRSIIYPKRGLKSFIVQSDLKMWLNKMRICMCVLISA